MMPTDEIPIGQFCDPVFDMATDPARREERRDGVAQVQISLRRKCA